MNKRGFVRTLEAVLAVIVVFLFIFYAGGSSSDEEGRFVDGIKSLQESILDDISKNDEMRKCVVEYASLDTDANGRDDISDHGVNKGEDAYLDSTSPCFGTQRISEFIDESLPGRFSGQGENFEFTVCEAEGGGQCRLPELKGNKVYTSAVIITSSLEGSKYKPRILRVWFF
jgi:hypothetical protein